MVKCLQRRRIGFSPGVGKIPCRREWQDSPNSRLENPIDRGLWRATAHGAAKQLGTRSDSTAIAPNLLLGRGCQHRAVCGITNLRRSPQADHNITWQSVLSGSSNHMNRVVLNWFRNTQRDFIFQILKGLYLNVLSHFSLVWLFEALWTIASQACCRWDSPGKNTGVGCHFLLQGSDLCFLDCRQNLYLWTTGKPTAFVDRVYQINLRDSPCPWLKENELSENENYTSPGWTHETSAQGRCTGKTQRDGMGREVGGEIGMGNTCRSMADSCQCMAKATTILWSN